MKMPCMRLRRCLMQSDFEAKALQNAKALLDKELKMAIHLQQLQEEKNKKKQKKPSLFSKIKGFFTNLF